MEEQPLIVVRSSKEIASEQALNNVKEFLSNNQTSCNTWKHNSSGNFLTDDVLEKMEQLVGELQAYKYHCGSRVSQSRAEQFGEDDGIKVEDIRYPDMKSKNKKRKLPKSNICDELQPLETISSEKKPKHKKNKKSKT